MRRSLAADTAESKSDFSSTPNRSSNEVLERRFRDFLDSDTVRRDFGVVGETSDCELLLVLRVLRTGCFGSLELDAVRRVFRTGFCGSITAGLDGPLGRIPELGLRVVRDGPLGRVGVVDGEVCERAGGPLLCVGGPRLDPLEVVPEGGPREGGADVLDGGDEKDRVGAGEEAVVAPNGLHSSSSSSS